MKCDPRTHQIDEERPSSGYYARSVVVFRPLLFVDRPTLGVSRSRLPLCQEPNHPHLPTYFCLVRTQIC